MNAKTLVFLLLSAGNSFAQGFAGLGTDAQGFAVPEPGKASTAPSNPPSSSLPRAFRRSLPAVRCFTAVGRWNPPRRSAATRRWWMA